MATDSKTSLAELSPIVSEASKQYGVPEDFIWGVIRAENSGSPRGAQTLKEVSTSAVSPKNARGVMQVTPVALQDVINSGLVPSTTSHENMSVRDQINVGTAYLSKLLKLSQDPAEVYAMYNYGPKARFRMADLPEETQNYLEKTGQRSSTTLSQGGGGTGTFGQGMLTSSDLISLLMQSTQQQNQAMQSAVQSASQGLAQGQQQAAQAIQGQRQAVENAMTIAGSKAAVDYAQNKTMEGLQQLFGMDPEATNNEIATSLATAKQARDARVSVRREYDELASTDLLSNPVGYLLAQLKMPGVAARNNALADAEDLALQNIDTRTRQLNAAKATLTANTADQIRENQLAQAQIDKRIADAKLSMEESKNSVAAATSQLQMAQVANQIGDNTRSALNVVISLEDRQEARSLRLAQQEEALKGKQLKEEEEARFNARLKVVSDSLGLVEPMTVSKLKTLVKPAEKEAWAYAGNTGSYGADLQDSVFFYLGARNPARTGSANNASTLLTATKLRDAAASYEAPAARELAAKNQGKVPKREDAISQGYLNYTAEVVNSMASPAATTDLSASAWDKLYNPYTAPFLSFNTAINSAAPLAGLRTNTVKVAIDDLLKSGAINAENLTAAQQQQVFASVIDQVASRKMLPKKAAAEIVAYIKGAAAFNLKMNNPVMFGLPVQENYMFTLEGITFGDSRQKVDLMNPIAVENALIKKAQKKALSRVTGFELAIGADIFGTREGER